MKQLVDVPTRETLNASSLLDVIFTTNDQSHKNKKFIVDPNTNSFIIQINQINQ